MILGDVEEILEQGEVAVLVDADLGHLTEFDPLVVVDARMRKRPPEVGMELAPLVIGLGPGFTAGKDCHAVIETMRGHTLGRVIWEGQAIPDTRLPEAVDGKRGERVLRAPAGGILAAHRQIGDLIQEGELIASVGGEKLLAPSTAPARPDPDGIEVRLA